LDEKSVAGAWEEGVDDRFYGLISSIAYAPSLERGYAACDLE
jgi:hypothetical protein